VANQGSSAARCCGHPGAVRRLCTEHAGTSRALEREGIKSSNAMAKLLNERGVTTLRSALWSTRTVIDLRRRLRRLGLYGPQPLRHRSSTPGVGTINDGPCYGPLPSRAPARLHPALYPDLVASCSGGARLGHEIKHDDYRLMFVGGELASACSPGAVMTGRTPSR
jgi:hypothetical protein